MGTTAEKGAYLLETKSQLKQAINNLGGDIDNTTTFREYVEELEGVYDSLPKTSYVEGSNVTITNGLKGKLDFDNGVVGIGQTEQDGTPTPDTPVAINSVTGNQDVVVSGKNLYNDNAETEAYYYNASGEKVASPSASETYINLEYNLSDTAITISRATMVGGANIRICEYNGTAFIKRTLTNVVSETITLDSNTTRVIFSINKSDTVYFTNLMIEKGSTATTYEPYITPTSYQLSLGEHEFNGIGDYKDELIYDVDEDRVYKNEKIRKKIFTGASSENWNLISAKTNTSAYAIDLNINYKLTGADSANALVNLFVGNPSGYSIDSECFWFNSSGYIRARIKNSIATNATQFKTWLSTNNLIVVYPLETPTLTEITDTTLKAQVKAWYNAHSNNGTTIITSNGNLPLVIKVRALKGA